MASMQAAPSGQRGASSQAPQGGGDLTEVQGQEEYYDQADRLLAGLIDISKIKRFKNSTTAVLHADDYANSMGITYDEIVSLTHKRNRVIKRRHPKQLKEFAVKILMKWMLSEEHFDFQWEKSELCRLADITQSQLNHWFTNARKRVWTPLRKARDLPIPSRTDLVRGRQERERAQSGSVAPATASGARSGGGEGGSAPRGVKRAGVVSGPTQAPQKRPRPSGPPGDSAVHGPVASYAPHSQPHFHGTSAQMARFHPMVFQQSQIAHHHAQHQQAVAAAAAAAAAASDQAHQAWRQPLQVVTGGTAPSTGPPSARSGSAGFEGESRHVSPTFGGTPNIGHLMASVRGLEAQGGLSTRSAGAFSFHSLGSQLTPFPGQVPGWQGGPSGIVAPVSAGGQSGYGASAAYPGPVAASLAPGAAGASLNPTSGYTPHLGQHSAAVFGSMAGAPVDGQGTPAVTGARLHTSPTAGGGRSPAAPGPVVPAKAALSLDVGGSDGFMTDLGDTPLPSRPIDTDRLAADGRSSGYAVGAGVGAAQGLASSVPPQPARSHAPLGDAGFKVTPRSTLPPVTLTSSDTGVGSLTPMWKLPPLATLTSRVSGGTHADAPSRQSDAGNELVLSPANQGSSQKLPSPVAAWMKQGHGVFMSGITPTAAGSSSIAGSAPRVPPQT